MFSLISLRLPRKCKKYESNHAFVCLFCFWDKNLAASLGKRLYWPSVTRFCSVYQILILCLYKVSNTDCASVNVRVAVTACNTYHRGVFHQSHVVSTQSHDKQYGSDVLETADPLPALGSLASNIIHPKAKSR